MRDVAIGPGHLEELDRIRLRELGIHVPAVAEGNAPECELGEEPSSMVKPRVVLADPFHDTHHMHLLAYLSPYALPLGRTMVLLSDAHERTYDGVHVTPRQEPKRTRVIIEDGGFYGI